MRPSRPLLPIRPLALPARLGRRQRRLGESVSFTEIRARFEQSNRAIARAARPVWLRGPLFQSADSPSSSGPVRHAA
jgi:hypothetical protein